MSYANRHEQRQDEERLRAAGWNIDLDGLWRSPVTGWVPMSLSDALAVLAGGAWHSEGLERQDGRMIDVDSALSLAIAALRQNPQHWDRTDPQPGDLVFETTHIGRPFDPDAIGWLIGHDEAPYNEDDPLDGSVPMRVVWDVLPLRGLPIEHRKRGYMRWENADFKRVPDKIRAATALNQRKQRVEGSDT